MPFQYLITTRTNTNDTKRGKGEGWKLSRGFTMCCEVSSRLAQGLAVGIPVRPLFLLPSYILGPDFLYINLRSRLKRSIVERNHVFMLRYMNKDYVQVPVCK